MTEKNQSSQEKLGWSSFLGENLADIGKLSVSEVSRITGVDKAQIRDWTDKDYIQNITENEYSYELEEIKKIRLINRLSYHTGKMGFGLDSAAMIATEILEDKENTGLQALLLILREISDKGIMKTASKLNEAALSGPLLKAIRKAIRGEAEAAKKSLQEFLTLKELTPVFDRSYSRLTHWIQDVNLGKYSDQSFRHRFTRDKLKAFIDKELSESGWFTEEELKEFHEKVDQKFLEEFS